MIAFCGVYVFFYTCWYEYFLEIVCRKSFLFFCHGNSKTSQLFGSVISVDIFAYFC
jgi:hypothetical protein